MKELFSWPFWVGLIIGWLLLARMIAAIRSKLVKHA